ncbi:MAG: hypothetical protein LBB82_08080 [Treponema sp.]|jgi:hypothetical protein|nr:hypothetical protein [Treponema sp.]
MKFTVWFSVLCLTGTLLAAQEAKDYKAIDSAVQGGGYAKAVAAIEKDGKDPKKAKIYTAKNDVLYNLDKGIVEHYAGQNDASFTNLEDAEKLIAEYSKPSISEGLAALVTSDNAKSYSGEAYEDMYDSVFNALNNYNRGDIEGARVEARQINEKLAKLLALQQSELKKVQEDAAKDIKGISMPPAEPVKFNSSALGSYINLVMLRGYTSVAPFVKQISDAYSSSPNVYSNPLPKSIAEEAAVANGKARINIIGFTGLSPVKEEDVTTIPLDGLGFLTAYIGVVGAVSGSAIPLTDVGITLVGKELRFAVPVISAEPRSAAINRIVVQIEGQEIELELLEDMGKVMRETFETKRSVIYAKTYTRSIIKTATAIVGFTAAQVAVSKESDLKKQIALKAAVKAADILVTNALQKGEKADTRMARYLPNRAYVGGITLDPGTYKATITFYQDSKAVGKPVEKTIEAKAGQPNILEAVNLQ